LVVGITAAIAGCSTPLTTREKGAINGDAVRSAEQKPMPMRVVFASPPPIVAPSPTYVWVPDWGVYVLEEYDIVYSDGYHYYFYEGHWYVARSCTGSRTLIASPPPTLAAVPPGHFHKRLPAGLAKQDLAPLGHMH
jgi:hypothetical protein